ncbi:MAG: hypothetical protein WD673_02060 [Alphaproteobacteria bacterium]
MAPEPRAEGVIIEFIAQGAYVRVTAFDPATMTEVAMVGATAAPRALLERTVLAKLDYVLRKRCGYQAVE